MNISTLIDNKTREINDRKKHIATYQKEVHTLEAMRDSEIESIEITYPYNLQIGTIGGSGNSVDYRTLKTINEAIIADKKCYIEDWEKELYTLNKELAELRAEAEDISIVNTASECIITTFMNNNNRNLTEDELDSIMDKIKNQIRSEFQF